ncbi:TonB-dependent receptor [Simiduia sp. 21SJ11W-1]|uniref:TonB-dependent receptor n=1 Tax=Simiduia sp. 21SJ11W-1 TaxID=2909669 RepID=UPI0020A1B7B8|nr:TonB-dependent receptor [Simiduia sp. 21SJ11W-1]UTA46993.1 TonB-dependent receptor [Simiduia sp. 21SJ11W-1]
MERKYLLTAFGYGILGLVLGIYMAATKNHGQLVTHAHIMLLGFVVTFVYAVVGKLWPVDSTSLMARIQFYSHQLATPVLILGLFLMYGGLAPAPVVGALLAVSSLVVLLSFILMKVMIIKALKQ